MTYGLKYTTTYCDEFGREYVVRILENNYSGVVTEVMAQTTPFELSYESSDDFKFSPIRASTVRINLILGNGTEMEEFWSANEKQFKVEYTKESALQWSGFVIPNGFSYNFTGGLYEATIEATDGLQTLEAIPFIDPNTGETYGEVDLTYNNGAEFPFVLIATEILRKLGLDINLWTCIDVYEKTMIKTGDREGDPWANSFVNVRTYINGDTERFKPYWHNINEAWNCFEVLQNILYMFSAKCYQSKGVWKIKRINADIDYGSGDNQRYWRKYNTLAVYLGKEIINDEINIPCSSKEYALIENDHTLSMDDVYKRFRVNYEFTFRREGDKLVNLLPDDFNQDSWQNSSPRSMPSGWERFSKRQNKFLAASKEMEFGVKSLDYSVRIGRQSPTVQSNDAVELTSRNYGLAIYERPELSQGDQLDFNFYAWSAKIDPATGFFLHVLFRAYIANEDRSEVYYLSNNPGKQASLVDDLIWRKVNKNIEQDGAILDSDINFFYVSMLDSPNTNWDWTYYERKVQKIPLTGDLRFEIYGYVTSRATNTSVGISTFTKFPVYVNINGAQQEVNYFGTLGNFPNNGDSDSKLKLSKLFLGVVRNTSEQPELQDYIIDNPDPLYTLQVDPITVYNGDTLDSDHLSKIIVPSNTGDGKNFWDTIDDNFGRSSLGLIQAKSVMELYLRPFRKLEGTVKAKDATLDSRFVFEAIPGRFFILQRGSFIDKTGYIESATFVEIKGTPITGGDEGENTLDPDWRDTGLTRCQKGLNGLNNGQVESQQQDENPNSETFGEIRWVVTSFSSLQCPFGEPDKFYAGTDDASLDISNLEVFGFTEGFIDGVQTVSKEYNNPGGEYIYFVHLQSLGNVFGVETTAQPEIISDFQYLSDIQINGFTYRVLRQNYVTNEFSNFTINFKIE